MVYVKLRNEAKDGTVWAMKIGKANMDAAKTRRYISCFFVYPCLFLVRFSSYLVPRNKKLWILGAPQKFEGNTKYLFLYIQQLKQRDIKTVWITKNKKLAQELSSFGYSAQVLFSLGGIWSCFRAKYYVVDTSLEAVSYWLAGGAKIVNLFHALPIKKMERDVDKGDSTEVTLFYSTGLLKVAMRFLFPWRFVKPDYVVSTSPLYTGIFSSMFRIGKEKIFEAGFPRNDVLFHDISGSQIGTDQDTLFELKRSKNKGMKICLYAPTFRDTGDRPFVEDLNLLKLLDQMMEKMNSVFVMKLHPFTKVVLPETPFKSIIFAKANSDTYPLLRYADIVVTDYSSIFVDFLLLDRPEVFFPYDLEKYVTKDRELYFDYNGFTPGPKAKTFNEFLSVLQKVLGGTDEYKDQRVAQRIRCFVNQDGNSSERTYQFLQGLLK